jgi:hypothetical protein
MPADQQSVHRQENGISEVRSIGHFAVHNHTGRFAGFSARYPMLSPTRYPHARSVGDCR